MISIEKIINYKNLTKIKNTINQKEDSSPRYNCNFPTMSVNGYVTVLEYNGYKKGIKKWDIWIPEGYNNIDDKLNKVKISNDKQIIFAIPGCDNIVSKYNVWKSLNKYYGRKKASTITPETFLLDKRKDIKLASKQETKFILKKKIQRKQGLKITSDIKDLKKGHKKDYLIAQKLIEPFLVNDRKINLRVYLMITLHKNKLTAYFSNFGSCIYTKEKYDKNSDSFETNITSYKMTLDIYKENPLTFNQLKTYLNDNNIDYTTLFDKIKNKLSLFLIAMKDQLGSKKFENNLCSQVFGIDFILDKNLEPFLLECNKGPEMKPKITMIEDPEEITDSIKENLEELKNILSNGTNDLDKIKSIKKYYNKIYKFYPKIVSKKEILKKIENFYKNEKELKSYPTGYITGNGLKVQKDSLYVLGIIESDNNGFEKILEI